MEEELRKRSVLTIVLSEGEITVVVHARKQFQVSKHHHPGRIFLPDCSAAAICVNRGFRSDAWGKFPCGNCFLCVLMDVIDVDV